MFGRVLLPQGEREGRKPSQKGAGWDWSVLQRAWIAEGFDPDAFWHQTERSFVIAMEGRKDARQRATDDSLFLAWHIEAFARQKRLRTFKHYQTGDRGKDASRGSAAVLGALRSLAAKGKATIEKIV